MLCWLVFFDCLVIVKELLLRDFPFDAVRVVAAMLWLIDESGGGGGFRLF